MPDRHSPLRLRKISARHLGWTDTRNCPSRKACFSRPLARVSGYRHQRFEERWCCGRAAWSVPLILARTVARLVSEWENPMSKLAHGLVALLPLGSPATADAGFRGGSGERATLIRSLESRSESLDAFVG